jgi:FAD/FMN-containing dehydrogenase
VSTVYGGPVFYPIEKAEEALRFYRDYMARIPDEMSAFFGFHRAPAAPFIPEHLHGVPMALIMTCYSGPLEQGEEVVRPVREFGPPAVDLVGPLPYPAINSMFDALYPPGLQHYWKADFVHELTDEILDIHAEHGPTVPGVQSGVHIYPLSGAPQRIASDATAFAYRDVDFIHNVLAIHPDPAAMPEHTAWVRDYWSALHPHSAGGTYVNFLMEEGQDRVRATYRGNYDRLAAVKAVYDPTNLFSFNQNIPPRA